MSRTRDYILQKNITNLFEELMKHILNAKPDNPVQFLIKVLQDNEDKLLNKEPTPSIRKNPGFNCTGNAIEIRKSMERMIPRAGHSNPQLQGDKRSSATITRDDLHHYRTLAEASSESITVEQDIFTAVESCKPAKNKDSSSSSSSDETIKSGKSDKSEKKKKKKKKEKKEKKEKMKDKDKEDGNRSEDDKKVSVEQTQNDEDDKDNFVENNDMNTLTCDLTEAPSWIGDDDLNVETVSDIVKPIESEEVGQVESSRFNAVNSANVAKTPIQSENDILQDEGLFVNAQDSRTTRDKAAGSRVTSARVTSPCTTVFFQSDDDSPPLIDDPTEVKPVMSQLSPEMEGQGYDVLDTYRSTTEAVDRNISLHSLLMEYDLSPLSDKISVSGLSGIEWAYAESVS